LRRSGVRVGSGVTNPVHPGPTFDKLAATCGEYLAKGGQVAVVGRLHLNEWTSGDGERRSRLQVAADTVQFLDKPKKTADPDGAVAESADKPDDRPAVGASSL
jgi:single-strand DNA-binding protein